MEKNTNEKPVLNTLGIEPLPEKAPRSRNRKSNSTVKYVPKGQKKIVAAIQEQMEQLDQDNRSDDQIQAEALSLSNRWEEELMRQQIHATYLRKFAELSHATASIRLDTSQVKQLQARAEALAAEEIYYKIVDDAKAQRLVANIGLEKAKRQHVSEVIHSERQALLEEHDLACKVHESEERLTQVANNSAAKTIKSQVDYHVAHIEKDTKVDGATVEMVKTKLQLQQTALHVAPVDHYVLTSADNFKFELKETPMRYEWRPAALCFVSLLFFACTAGWLPLVPVLFTWLVVSLSAAYVALQIKDERFRYSQGDITYYSTRSSYARIPGKVELPGDLRQATDRKDLIQYDGLVRFADVQRKYVKNLTFLKFKLPFRILKIRNTVTAVSIGALQQIITKRISFTTSESQIRSSLEYNLTNMTFINIDKELMFIEHPDSFDKHGFAVYQDTVDFAYGWFMSQKQRTRHVPRSRAAVSQPKY